MKSNRLVFLALAAAALLLSACRIVVETQVNPDGSGELRTAVVYAAEENEAFVQTPGNESKSICDNLKDDAPAEAAFTEESRDGEVYCVTTRPFARLGELRRLYAGMSNVAVNELKMELGQFVFDVDVDLTAPGPGGGEPVATEWRLTRQYSAGALGEHNADRVDGQTLIWTVSPGDKDHLKAESAVGLSLASLGAAGAAVLAGVCAPSVAAAWGASMFLLLRRRRPAAPPGGTGT